MPPIPILLLILLPNLLWQCGGLPPGSLPYPPTPLAWYCSGTVVLSSGMVVAGSARALRSFCHSTLPHTRRQPWPTGDQRLGSRV
eukprot:631620-Rhodomonas_salina.1